MKATRLIALILVVIALIAGILYYGFPGTVATLARHAELAAADLHTENIQVGDHRIHYAIGGSGETVLMLHGFAADLYSWPRMARSLTTHYRVVAPDLPGFGLSSQVPSDNYDIAHQAERIRAFMDRLGLRQVHLVGNSMGGWIAADFAARYPDRVKTLTLIDTGGITTPRPSVLMKDLEAGRNPLVVHNNADFDRLLNLVFYRQPWLPAPLKKYFADEAITHAPFNDKIFDDLKDNYLALEPLLPAIKMPTLVIWGAHDHIIDPTAVRVLQAGLPNVTVKILNTGHAPMLEQPQATAEEFLDFLKAHGD